MRKLLAASIVAALGLGAASAAGAQQTPTAQFTAPRTATGGSPVWVRSIDPCPSMPGEYMYVLAGFTPQLIPEGEPAGTVSDSTAADIRPDGSWEVTITAPSDFPEGVTKSYTIHAACIVVIDPYAVEGEGEAVATTSTTSSTSTTAPGATTTTTAAGGETEPERKITVLRYEYRTLRVTSSGDAGAAPAGDATTDTTVVAAGTASGGTTTSKSWSSPSGYQQYSGPSDDDVVVDAAAVDDVDTVENPVDPDDVRRELLRQQGSGDIELATSAVASDSPQRQPVDGGIPWWAFAAATMLAVGAVVGYGTRRSSAV